jgi:hypothetical protein
MRGFSFQQERDSAAEQVNAPGLLRDLAIQQAGPVPEDARETIFRDDAPTHLVGHKNEVTGSVVQNSEKAVRVVLDGKSVFIRMMVEIAQPHGQAVYHSYFAPART